MAEFRTQDGTKIYYNDWGQGTPTVMIHGWPLSGDMWEYQSRALSENGFRVITYDRRGFGRSDQPAQGYNYDIFALDLAELIDHLKLAKVNLIGFSMGGGEVVRYISKFGSHRVNKTVLISSVVPYMLETPDNPEGVPDSIFQDIIQGLKEDRPGFLKQFTKDFYGYNMISQSVSKEILRWTSFMAYQASPVATIKCVTAFGTTDFRQDLKRMAVPTLVIHGKADKTVPIEPTSMKATELIPDAVSRFYDDAAHGLFVTHKNQLMEDFLKFLN